MEVVLNRDAFLKGLQMVQNIVEPRQTLPILANVLLETDGEAVRLTATDLEVGARVAVPARVAGKGAITVSARKLAEIVKELPAADLSLRVQDNAAVSLKCGTASYKLVGMAPDDFPPVVASAQAAWIKLEAKTLREMLAATSFAISHDETRYALNGVLFALAGKDARLVATDGHRLAMASRMVGNVGAAVTGIVPRKAVVEIQRVLGAGEEVQIALTENQFLMQMPNFLMTARLIEGQFPNYEMVLPKNIDKSVEFDCALLNQAVRRVALMSDERSHAIRFHLEANQLVISAQNAEEGEASENIQTDYTGEDVDIGFNAQYLQDFMNVNSEGKIAFEFKDGNSQAQLRPVSMLVDFQSLTECLRSPPRLAVLEKALADSLQQT